MVIDYKYISVKEVNGTIKVVCNKYEKPKILTFDEAKRHGFVSIEKRSLVFESVLRNWHKNHETFQFESMKEWDKVSDHLVNTGTPNDYSLLKQGIEVTCVEIKSFFDDNNVKHTLAYFKSDKIK